MIRIGRVTMLESSLREELFARPETYHPPAANRTSQSITHPMLEHQIVRLLVYSNRLKHAAAPERPPAVYKHVERRLTAIYTFVPSVKEGFRRKNTGSFLSKRYWNMTATDAIIKVIELLPRFGELVEAKARKRKRLFEEYFTPLHMEMEKVRESYMAIFVSFRNDLRRCKNPKQFRAALEKFIDARDPVVLARGKVISGLSEDAVKIWRKKIDSSVWGHEQDDKIEAGLYRLAFYTGRFFSGGDLSRGGTSSLASRLSGEIRHFITMSDDELRALAPEAIPHLVMVINEMLKLMERTWLAASKEFNELRLHYK